MCFQNEPTWGGLRIDDKGVYWETLSEMARHFGREDDLILLQVRPEDASLHWQPKHTYNLTSDRSIPYNTFAKAVVDTASSLGQAGDKGFFKNQAQIHIAAALETLRENGVAMPQKFQLERRYVNTFLKMLFYTHALRRFDKPAEERRRDNLLILWADEAQRFVTASEDGMSDYNCIDVIREARATVVAAAQSSSSFIPPLGREKARVFTLNLRNRLIFKAADEEGAVESADFLGRQRAMKKSWGYSGGKMSRNYSEKDEHKIKPHLLRNLAEHTAVVIHCERGHRRKRLPPIEPNGEICSWFTAELLIASFGSFQREAADVVCAAAQLAFMLSIVIPVLDGDAHLAPCHQDEQPHSGSNHRSRRVRGSNERTDQT
jgi:hypothetical protein